MDFFKRHFLVPLIAVLGLVAIAYIGVAANLQLVFGVVIPYLAVLIFFEGLIFRVISWARSPVPFKIPSTCAQGKTLPWIKRDLTAKLDNPENKLQVFGRMALEVLAFRSLFRNTRSELQRNQEKPEDSRLIHWSYKWLWLGALAFHYAFLLVILRHIRFFTRTRAALGYGPGGSRRFCAVLYSHRLPDRGVHGSGADSIYWPAASTPRPCATSPWPRITFPCCSSLPSASAAS